MARPRRVARGVELFPALTPTLPPATHTNSYAVGEREVLLIEPATPYDDERRAWLEWARAFQGQGRRAVAIALTHHHVDHVGAASFFADALGLPIWAHAETAARLPDVSVSRHLKDGETIVLEGASPQRITVLHTPGHAPGHVCFFDEEAGTAIVGDMVASVGSILIPPDDGDMAAYLEQLERLAQLAAHVALPAHGEPIDAPSELFRRYIAHRVLREGKVLLALAGAPSEGASLDALVPVVYEDTSPLLWPLGRLSLEAHLVKLIREGRVTRAASGAYRKVDAA